eukprot:COSAG04_NODE_3156_length_3106_cov_2.178916_1_plen_463_part_00
MVFIDGRTGHHYGEAPHDPTPRTKAGAGGCRHTVSKYLTEWCNAQDRARTRASVNDVWTDGGKNALRPRDRVIDLTSGFLYWYKRKAAGTHGGRSVPVSYKWEKVCAVDRDHEDTRIKKPAPKGAVLYAPPKETEQNKEKAQKFVDKKRAANPSWDANDERRKRVQNNEVEDRSGQVAAANGYDYRGDPRAQEARRRNVAASHGGEEDSALPDSMSWQEFFLAFGLQPQTERPAGMTPRQARAYDFFWDQLVDGKGGAGGAAAAAAQLLAMGADVEGNKKGKLDSLGRPLKSSVEGGPPSSVRAAASERLVSRGCAPDTRWRCVLQDFWWNIGVVTMDLRGEVDQVPVVLCEEPQARPGKVLKGRKLDGHVDSMKLKLRDVSIGMSHGTPVRRPARCRSAHSTTMTGAVSVQTGVAAVEDVRAHARRGRRAQLHGADRGGVPPGQLSLRRAHVQARHARVVP